MEAKNMLVDSIVGATFYWYLDDKETRKTVKNMLEIFLRGD